jgi:hypothetical protein
MTTRFYFRTPLTSDIGITPSPLWELTAGYVTGRLTPEPIGSYQYAQDITVSSAGAGTAPRDMLAAAFLSDPLDAQTLSGTFSMVLGVGQNAASDDEFMQVIIRVLSGDGLTVRGTAYSGSALTTVSTTPSAVNYEAATGVWSHYLLNVALSNVNIQQGDRISVEVGSRITQSTTSAGFTTRYTSRDDGVDLPLTADRGIFENNIRPWIEFSADLVVQPTSEQARFRKDGVLLNTSPSLPFVDLSTIDGIDSAPVSSSTQDREGVHGGYVASQFQTIRTVTLEGNAYASPTGVDAYLDKLKANFAPTIRPHYLYVGTDNGVRALKARSQGLRYAKTTERRLGIIPIQVQLLCDDPRMYSPDEVIVGPSSAGSVNLVNNGNRDTPLHIELQGAVNSPSFSLINSYGIMGLSFSSLSLAFGENLDIETDTRTITRNTSNARSLATLSGKWINLAPGNNTLQFGKASGTGVYVVNYRHAWE